MRTGKNYVEVWIRESDYDWTSHKTLVKWEYDANGGNEKCKHWFDCQVIEYPEGFDEDQKKQIDEELKQMDIDKIMITEFN